MASVRLEGDQRIGEIVGVYRSVVPPIDGKGEGSVALRGWLRRWWCIGRLLLLWQGEGGKWMQFSSRQRPVPSIRAESRRRGGAVFSGRLIPVRVCPIFASGWKRKILSSSYLYFTFASPLLLFLFRTVAIWRGGVNKGEEEETREVREGGGETQAVSSLSLSSPRARWIQSSEPSSSSSCRKTQMGEITPLLLFLLVDNPTLFPFFLPPPPSLAVKRFSRNHS